jgi:hypothetical protein
MIFLLNICFYQLSLSERHLFYLIPSYLQTAPSQGSRTRVEGAILALGAALSDVDNVGITQPRSQPGPIVSTNSFGGAIRNQPAKYVFHYQIVCMYTYQVSNNG